MELTTVEIIQEDLMLEEGRERDAEKKQVKCKICGCELPSDLFSKGDNCPKCDDLIMDAMMEGVENGNDSNL
jgi:hypothetical protein